MADIMRAADWADGRFRAAGFTGGGPLWFVDSNKPRYRIYVWQSPARIWHAFTIYGHGSQATKQLPIERPTRRSLIEAYERTLEAR